MVMNTFNIGTLNIKNVSSPTKGSGYPSYKEFVNGEQ